MRNVAALLDEGRSNGLTAAGRWDGVELTIGHVLRVGPAETHTVVEVRPAPTPLAAVIQPWTRQDAELPYARPVGRPMVDEAYVIDGAPRPVVEALFDDRAVELLGALDCTHVTIAPGLLRVRHTHFLDEPYEIKPLIELAAHFARRVREVTRDGPALDSKGDPYRPVVDVDLARRREREVADQVRRFLEGLDGWLVR